MGLKTFIAVLMTSIVFMEIETFRCIPKHPGDGRSKFLYNIENYMSI
jgi:hypothetical protein